MIISPGCVHSASILGSSEAPALSVPRLLTDPYYYSYEYRSAATIDCMEAERPHTFRPHVVQAVTHIITAQLAHTTHRSFGGWGSGYGAGSLAGASPGQLANHSPRTVSPPPVASTEAPLPSGGPMGQVASGPWTVRVEIATWI